MPSMRSIRVAIALALVGGVFAVAPAQPSRASGPEGCVVTNPANPGFSNPCTYTATTIGGISGVGTFKVTIKRGKKKITYTDKKGNQWGIGVIKAGDTVTAQAVSSGSVVTVGNPCPAGIPGAC
jgi:hypothetical protein